MEWIQKFKHRFLTSNDWLDGSADLWGGVTMFEAEMFYGSNYLIFHFLRLQIDWKL